ncbi:MAG: hypothetical protein ACFCD0_10925 [Gemmataceae bacterium]
MRSRLVPTHFCIGILGLMFLMTGVADAQFYGQPYQRFPRHQQPFGPQFSQRYQVRERNFPGGFQRFEQFDSRRGRFGIYGNQFYRSDTFSRFGGGRFDNFYGGHFYGRRGYCPGY